MADGLLLPSRVGGETLRSVTGSVKSLDMTGGVSSVEAYTSGKSKYIVDSSFDIEKVNRGDLIEINGCTNASNNGIFKVKGLDKDSNYIYLSNSNAVNEGASSGSATFRYKVMMVHTKNIV